MHVRILQHRPRPCRAVGRAGGVPAAIRRRQAGQEIAQNIPSVIDRPAGASGAVVMGESEDQKGVQVKVDTRVGHRPLVIESENPGTVGAAKALLQGQEQRVGHMPVGTAAADCVSGAMAVELACLHQGPPLTDKMGR